MKAIGVNTPPELRKKPGIYDVTSVGLNYRLTDFQAALAVGQMKRYPSNLLKRKKMLKNICSSYRKIKKFFFRNIKKNTHTLYFRFF